VDGLEQLGTRLAEQSDNQVIDDPGPGVHVVVHAHPLQAGRAVADAIGGDLFRRIRSALGDDADRALIEALLLAFSGAMLQAGMGYFDFAGVVERMESVARQLDHTGR